MLTGELLDLLTYLGNQCVCVVIGEVSFEPDLPAHVLTREDHTEAVMRNANIELERVGEMSVARNERSPDAVAEAILDLDGAQGVTMTITPEGAGEHLMVAVDGSRAFLGLERSDGLLQFVVHGDSLERVRAFSIGRQKSEIEDRYLPEVRTAAVREYFGRVVI